MEVPDGHERDPALVAEIDSAIRARLLFRSLVTLVPESSFGDSGYKTRLTVTRP